MVPRGRITRPARALVRRSIFDSIAQEIAGAHWLDLYAGSGAFGIEALSRGAACACFLDSGKESLRCLHANLAGLGIEKSQALVVAADLPRALELPPPPLAPFSVISMDPPFAVSRGALPLADLTRALGRACGSGWFTAEALLIWEEPAGSPDPVPGGFLEVQRKGHGTSRVRFFRRRRP